MEYLDFEPQMIHIPAGEFLMGSDPKKDKAAYADEMPQHTLFLPDYYLAKTPVTNAQYLAFVQATSNSPPIGWQWGKPPRGKESHPVVRVYWRDAVAYCEWLSEVTGRPYRLPSEAEWEKAARGTDGRTYPWGNQWDASRCNVRVWEPDIQDTMPVGRYSPRGDSPYGCADMAGNVWEWTSSLEKSYPYRSDDGREDMDSSGCRVLRGGCFGNGRKLTRSACRRWDFPDSRPGCDGFRVAASFSPSSDI